MRWFIPVHRYRVFFFFTQYVHKNCGWPMIFWYKNWMWLPRSSGISNIIELAERESQCQYLWSTLTCSFCFCFFFLCTSTGPIQVIFAVFRAFKHDIICWTKMKKQDIIVERNEYFYSFTTKKKRRGGNE